MLSKETLVAAAAAERFELYCVAHPGTPSAVRRPQLIFKSAVWVALLGPSIKEGIAGFGITVESALSAFDFEYRNRLRPPADHLAAPAARDGDTEERPSKRPQVSRQKLNGHSAEGRDHRDGAGDDSNKPGPRARKLNHSPRARA
jgi:hypothetical protein